MPYSLDDFPIRTNRPRIDVTLPVGRHEFELVVVDSAGLRSAPTRLTPPGRDREMPRKRRSEVGEPLSRTRPTIERDAAMKLDLRKVSIFLALAATLGTLTAPAAASHGKSSAVFSDPQLDPAACTLTVSSSKDVSNYTLEDAKTELDSGTTTLVLPVRANDVVTVKSGTSVWTYTVPADFCTGTA